MEENFKKHRNLSSRRTFVAMVEIPSFKLLKVLKYEHHGKEVI